MTPIPAGTMEFSTTRTFSIFGPRRLAALLIQSERCLRNMSTSDKRRLRSARFRRVWSSAISAASQPAVNASTARSRHAGSYRAGSAGTSEESYTTLNPKVG